MDGLDGIGLFWKFIFRLFVDEVLKVCFCENKMSDFFIRFSKYAL